MVIKFDNRHQPTRVVIEAVSGFGCYDGSLSDADTFNATHAGHVGSLEDADRWLRGEPAESFTVIHAGPNADHTTAD
jgi:hypothetical protein